MRSLPEIRKTLKNQPFYSEEIKRKKKISNIKFLSELPFFSKKSKKLTIKQLADVLLFPPKRKKKKDLKD